MTSLAASALTISAVGKGATNVTVTATDTGGLTAQHVFRVMVPNRVPEAVGAIPDQTLDPGQTITVDLSLFFNDPDGDQLTYSTALSVPGVVTLTLTASDHLLQVDATGRGSTLNSRRRSIPWLQPEQNPAPRSGSPRHELRSAPGPLPRSGRYALSAGQRSDLDIFNAQNPDIFGAH